MIGILNFHFADNYGAVLVAYSLQKQIQKLSYSSSNINFIPDSFSNKIHTSAFQNFRNKFILSTNRYSSFEGLLLSNGIFDKIIVGSDQVFRMHYNHIFMLNWVSGQKTLISYASSFGAAKLKANLFEKIKSKKLLSRFDAHSVRESSGVSIMKNTFGLDAIQVLDPTLLLDPQDYQPIIDSEPCAQPEKYVGVMFLDDEHWDEFRASALYKKLSAEYEIVNICKDEQGDFRSVPQWLSYIKHASLMVTDSFHGTVFSIIYRKQFITRATANRGNARLESLCSTLDIPLSRFCPSFDKKNDTQFDTLLDFAPVWKRIEEERVVSLDYLKRSLALKPTYKEFIPVRRDRLSIPILSIEEREHDKRLLLFGCIPVVCKPLKGNSMYLFGKIPFSRETLSRLKRRLLKR